VLITISWRRIAIGAALRFALGFLLFNAAFAADAKRAPSVPPNVALVVSDIHFNPMADPGIVPKLEAAEPAAWQAILSGSKSTGFSQYGQDTNWWLLRSSLDQMQKTLPRPAVVLFTGDSLAHQFPQLFQSATKGAERVRYRKFVLKTMQFLALQLRKRFPQSKILITPGNDDDDCGNYTIEADGAFLRDTAEMARALAKGNDDVRSSWEHLGSFDVPHPTVRGVRILSLNTVFFSDKYQSQKFSAGCAVMPSDAPNQAFAWLESRLEQAQNAHQKVWLMFHIPPGIDPFTSLQTYRMLRKNNPAQADSPQLCTSAVVPLWVPARTAQFDELLQKYRGTIVAVFAGHTHNDDFRLPDRASADSPFVLINPPISPVYNQNPAFRTVTFASDGSLADSTVYYLSNLTLAGGTTAGEWQREYQFSKEWKLTGINTTTLTALNAKIRSDESVRDEWLKLYNVSSPAARVLPGTAPGLYCATDEMNRPDYSQCYCPIQPGKTGVTP
jgi:sphingomyelin phosphodiesterase acid-like 3